MIRLVCAGCQRTLQVQRSVAGRRIYCPRCRHINLVPEATATSAAAPLQPQAAAPSAAAAVTLPPPAPADAAATLPPGPAVSDTATLPPRAAFTDAPPATLPPRDGDAGGASAEAALVNGSPDGKRLFSGSADKTITAWDFDAGK
jgi:hypothetical protein